jgi:FkbM family methyltransferase
VTDHFLAKHDGFWWPGDDLKARDVITRDCEPAVAAFLKHFSGRDLIVQAGANVGVYPLALARHFNAVYTAEPDPANYECLKRNLAEHDPGERIVALWAAFGETEGGCTPLVVEAANCGAHRVNFAKGTIPVWTIDGLELTACDAIWLDIEGAELHALKGAAGTIQQFSPVIAVEDKGLHRAYDIPDGAIREWLTAHGYAEVDRIGNDKVFRRYA